MSNIPKASKLPYKTPHAVPVEQVFQPGIFRGKVLFITGGGSGIGKVITERMMRLGASAAIVGRNGSRLEEAASELSTATRGTCIPTQADVRKPEELRKAVEKTVDKFGRIDFVVCGAAGNFLAPIEGLSENAFRTVIEIDTLGTFNTVKATLPYIRESHGCYVHISVTPEYRSTPFQAHVSTAKAGVDTLSRILAIEEGPRGVRSNVVAPGAVASTPGWDRLTRQGPSASAAEAGYAATFPLQRVGVAGDTANAVVFLCSDAANFITGQAIGVDGASSGSKGILPYPQSVLDPESIKGMIKGKL